MEEKTPAENNLNNGGCNFCGEKIPGVWKA